MFEDFEVVHSYSRKQAIEDGVLVDLSPIAREAGFRFPVAMTQAAWYECMEVPKGAIGQTAIARLHDVLWLLHCAIKREKSGDTIFFKVTIDNGDRGTVTHTLKSICHGGDDLEPVLTILLPSED